MGAIHKLPSFWIKISFLVALLFTTLLVFLSISYYASPDTFEIGIDEDEEFIQWLKEHEKIKFASSQVKPGSTIPRRNPYREIRLQREILMEQEGNGDSNQIEGSRGDLKSGREIFSEPPVEEIMAVKERLWPQWWNAQKEEQLMDDIAIGIVTTQEFHGRIKYQLGSWWSEERRDIAEVFTDAEHDNSIPNSIYTHCDSSYHYGLWCKNTHMMKVWQSPRYRKVKWFIRANDDSYYHLENIHDYLSKLDHTIPQVIGDLYCYPPNTSYPAGGCGFIFSRAVIDELDWFLWNKPIRNNLKITDYWEDVQWGQYLNDTHTALIAHPGITQAPFKRDSQTLLAYMSFAGKPWPFPYRPLATHQAKQSTFLPALHKMLHSLQYVPESDIKFTIPPCRCRHGLHSRCLWDHSMPIKKSEKSVCRWAHTSLRCLGPHTYTLEAYQELVDASKGNKK